jgi:hypothetical protein
VAWDLLEAILLRNWLSTALRLPFMMLCLDPCGWNYANIKEIKDQVEFVKGDALT